MFVFDFQFEYISDCDSLETIKEFNWQQKCIKRWKL